MLRRSWAEGELRSRLSQPETAPLQDACRILASALQPMNPFHCHLNQLFHSSPFKFSCSNSPAQISWTWHCQNRASECFDTAGVLIVMQSPHIGNGKVAPSSRWTSYDGWDYGGMKERLEKFMSTVNKEALITHAKKLFQKNCVISEPFSAGQYWACFELIADDSSLLIARARLPRHPGTGSTMIVT